MNYELVKVDANRYAENPAVKAIVAKAEAPFENRLRDVIGRTDGPLLRYEVLEASMNNVIADVVRHATPAQIAVTNGFRFSMPIQAGPITEAEEHAAERREDEGVRGAPRRVRVFETGWLTGLLSIRPPTILWEVVNATWNPWT